LTPLQTPARALFPQPPAAMADSSYQKMEEGMAPSCNISLTSTDGLTSEEAARRLELYGRNEVPEDKEPLWKMFAKQFMGTMPMMIELAAVLSVAIGNWADFGIIFALLMTNATLGFVEEKNAQASVDALKDGLKRKLPVKRDGKFVTIDIAEFVPGDILFLRGGNVIPADCYWVDGDELAVDQAALTGESLPVQVPREDEEGEPNSGKKMWSGSIIKQGECHCVIKDTGIHTMIGDAAKAIQESGGKQIGLFESKIIDAVRVLILITIMVVVGLIYFEMVVKKKALADVLEMSLCLVIASVPVALPMVMKVTLSIGAKEMADEGGIVTHLTALEEIASMRVLCSDKTGTLTTASMTVYHEQAAVFNGFVPEKVMELAALASNAANKDDPIDAAVFKAYAKMTGHDTDVDTAAAKLKESFTTTQYAGFNPLVKRTVAQITELGSGRKYQVAKGIVSKVLRTDPDDGGIQWTVEDYDNVKAQVAAADEAFGRKGYKTIAVAVATDGGGMVYAGTLPIMDPPRTDTAETISKIKTSEVGVKMITGDHLNIAKELARQIQLGTDILPNNHLWPASDQRDELILGADGFAQVMPKDKHEVVAVLQKAGLVVGMTGDGVNDAPALARAQIGIAVQGATDAAQSAADIVLTRPGLSPIYTAIQVSRRIFKRLKSYVVYRICITVQVVGFLTCLSFFYGKTFKPLYIILLALFHDLQIVTIAYDNQVASLVPERPSVLGLLLLSYVMGILTCASTIVLYAWGDSFLSEDFLNSWPYKESTMFLQISNFSAIIIFSARSHAFFFSSAPAKMLVMSTAIGQVLVNAALLVPGGIIVEHMALSDILLVWIYDFAWLFLLDLAKMLMLHFWEEHEKTHEVENPAMRPRRKSLRKSVNSVEPNTPARRASQKRKSGTYTTQV